MDPASYPDRSRTWPAPVPAAGDEKGPKDTVIANPGEVTRIRLEVRPPDFEAGNDEAQYVFHCHILEHEENEMMRPFKVV